MGNLIPYIIKVYQSIHNNSKIKNIYQQNKDSKK